LSFRLVPNNLLKPFFKPGQLDLAGLRPLIHKPVLIRFEFFGLGFDALGDFGDL
jgi:hypothetical protein